MYKETSCDKKFLNNLRLGYMYTNWMFLWETYRLTTQNCLSNILAMKIKFPSLKKTTLSGKYFWKCTVQAILQKELTETLGQIFFMR